MFATNYTTQSNNPAIHLIMFAASVREVNMSVPAAKKQPAQNSDVV